MREIVALVTKQTSKKKTLPVTVGAGVERGSFYRVILISSAKSSAVRPDRASVSLLFASVTIS